MSTSVDGLVSGLSTSSLISQLMQVEAAPQTRLKSKVTTAQTAVNSYLSVNNKLSTLQSAAKDLGRLPTWRAVAPTSSSPTVTATAVTGATNTASGTTVFDVVELAANQLSTAKVSKDGPIASGDTLTITIGPEDGSSDSKQHTITLGEDRSAKGVAEAINKAGIGVKALVVTTGGDSNILQLSGSKTGKAAAFTVTGLDQLSSELRKVSPAVDAKLNIGGGDDKADAGGYSVTSPTNTFGSLMPGVSITVTKKETGVTVTADSDVAGMAGKMQALVDSINGALAEVKTQTAYDAATKKSSPLTGDFMVRNISQTLLSKISLGITYANPAYDKDKPTDAANKVNLEKISISLAKLGVELQDDGTLKFDAKNFKTNYELDPAQFQAAAITFADKMQSLAFEQSKSVTSVVTGRNNEIDSLNDQIGNWDLRLSARKAALQKQYSDLEVSLGKLKEQSNWLAGQLAGLG